MAFGYYLPEGDRPSIILFGALISGSAKTSVSKRTKEDHKLSPHHHRVQISSKKDVQTAFEPLIPLQSGRPCLCRRRRRSGDLYEDTSTSTVSTYLYCACFLCHSRAADLANSTFTPLIFSCIFYACNGKNHISYIDSLTNCVSAMTVCGLATVDLSSLTAWQQVILFIQMCMGSPVCLVLLLLPRD